MYQKLLHDVFQMMGIFVVFCVQGENAFYQGKGLGFLMLFLSVYWDFFLQLDKFTKRCDIIISSLDRHKTRYFSQGIESNTRYSNYIMRNPQTTGTISQVELIMNNGKGCEKYPHEDMDEHCKLFKFFTRAKFACP